MKPSIRLLKVLTAATWKGTDDPAARPSADNPQAATVTRWRVLPTDLDLFGHMNNGRYLMLMDFARVDYLARMGLIAEGFRRRWIAPVATVQVDFRRPLKPFQKFEIATQTLSWDQRWFYMRQTFRMTQCPDRVVATAYVKTIFCSPAGRVAPRDVVRIAIGHDLPAPVLPDHLQVRFGFVSPAARVDTPNVGQNRRALSGVGDQLAHHTPGRLAENLPETLPA